MKTGAVLVGDSHSEAAVRNRELLRSMGIDPIVDTEGDLQLHSGSLIFFDTVRFLKTERCDRVLLLPAEYAKLTGAKLEQLLCVEAAVVRPIQDGKYGYPLILSLSAAKEVLTDLREEEDALHRAIKRSGLPVCDMVVFDPIIVRPSACLNLATDDVFFGTELAEILRKIDRTGSKQAAFDEAGVSYSKGSQMIKRAEYELGYRLLSRWSGGATGGGSTLTDEGRELLEKYDKMSAELTQAAEMIFRKYM